MNILITGGTSGLGEAAVKKLSENSDHKIFFTYAKSKEKALLQEASAPNIIAINCDFNDSVSVDELVQKLAEHDINILINNAIIGYKKDYFHKIDSDVFATSFALNILPVIKITQAFIKLRRKKRFGKIINIITSAIVNKPPVGWSEYVANKAYLLSLSKSWAIENAQYKITSNAISPAFMVTNLTSDTDERILEEMVTQHPLKSLLTTNEVAHSIAYLVDCSQQINGINLVINAAANIY